MPASLPKITVVTPSYNQAQYIEQTILSVIYQGYGNLEYIVLDGGSTDGSVEIIKKYEKHIDYWHSKKDNGQGAAINEGFARATGEIFYFLNSDDILMPGALLRIGELFKSVTTPTVIFGNCMHFHQTRLKVRSSDIVNDRKNFAMNLYNYMIQPSSFCNRAAWETTGVFNEDIYYAIDWDWFLRAERAGVNFIPLNDYLSLFRWHEAHKTGVKGKDNPRDMELVKIYETYANKKIAMAFAKIRRVRNGSKFVNDVIHASNIFNITPLRRLLHILICPSIKYYEYFSLTHM